MKKCVKCLITPRVKSICELYRHFRGLGDILMIRTRTICRFCGNKKTLWDISK